MTPISDDMVERGAVQHNPLAFEKDDDGNYTQHIDARTEARKEVRAILTAALEGSVAVPREFLEEVSKLPFFKNGKIEALVKTASDLLAPAAAITRQDRGGSHE